MHELDIADPDGHRRLIRDVRPDEFYNLAGLSSVRQSFDDPAGTWRSNADAVFGLLEAIRLEHPTTRFFQSSSTDMFGSSPGKAAIHDEASAFMPQSPYAAAKAAAHVLCDAYRRAFDLRVACGILSNHESRRRPASFLTAKVVAYVRSLRESAGDGSDFEPLRIGNLAVRREWGFASEYVDGMIRICRQIDVRADVLGRQREADVGSNYRDYVLGSGRQHAVWELIDRAFGVAGLPLAWDRDSSDPTDWTARLATTRQPGRRRRSVFHPARRPGHDRNEIRRSPRTSSAGDLGAISTGSCSTCWLPTRPPRTSHADRRDRRAPVAPRQARGTPTLARASARFVTDDARASDRIRPREATRAWRSPGDMSSAARIPSTRCPDGCVTAA